MQAGAADSDGPAALSLALVAEVFGQQLPHRGEASAERGVVVGLVSRTYVEVTTNEDCLVGDGGVVEERGADMINLCQTCAGGCLTAAATLEVRVDNNEWWQIRLDANRASHGSLGCP